MPPPLANLNGQLVPLSAFHLSPTDAGFVWGATVTDRCRTFHHRLDRLTEHITRFRQSCTAAQVSQQVPDAEIVRRAEELVAHNAALLAPEADLTLILFATPGPPGGPPTLGLHTAPLDFALYRGFLTEGVRLVTPHLRQVPSTCINPLIKHRSRLHWWLAEQEVKNADSGAAALLLDLEGHITETATANFLLVRGGWVLTPPRKGVLNGISLQTVEELCDQIGIPFEERPLRPDDCRSADEAWLSNASFCLAPVSRINDQPLPFLGPLFARLLAAWGERVGLDIRAQIMAER